MIHFMIHGLGGSSDDWEKVIPNGKKVLWTQKLGGSFEDCAQEIATEIQAQPEPVIIWGYSMGGRLALTAATHIPKDKIQSLILISTGFGSSNEEWRKVRQASDESWANLAEKSPEEFWQKWYEQPVFSTFSGLSEEARGQWLSRRNRLDPATVAHQFRKLGQGMHSDLLPTLKNLASTGIPILYLAGEKDKKYKDLSKELAALGLETKVAPQAGHILPLEAPQFLVEEVELFLRNQ